MSKQDITLSAKKRDVFGKQVSRLRNEGQTPAVVHEKGKDSLHVSVNSGDFKKVYSAAGKHHAIKLDVEGKKYITLLKDVLFAPGKSNILHAVFQAIKADEKVTAEIPLKLSGEIPAERANLLVLTHMDHVVVEALPKDLVDVVEVDASSLAEVGDKLHISDIKFSGDVTIKNDPEQAIVTVEMPKDQIAEADAALEEQQAAEGGVAEGETSEESKPGDASEGEQSEKPSGEKSTDSDSKES